MIEHGPAASESTNHGLAASEVTDHRPAANEVTDHRPAASDVTEHGLAASEVSDHRPAANEVTDHGPAADRCALLARSRTVAVVGASPDSERPSYRIFTYLHERAEFEATPINPDVGTVAGVRTYPTLAAYAAQRGAPDIVNVFRRPSEAAAVARDAIAAGARAIWFQLGVATDEAIALARDAGLTVVSGCCIKVELRHCDERAASKVDT